MTEQNPTYAILLAGGKSSRMKQDKALLPVGNKKLIMHQTELLKRLCDNVVISRNETPYVSDIYKDSGPLAGIHAAINSIASKSRSELSKDALVLPVDMPLITPELIKNLVATGKAKHKVVYYQDNNLPIYIPNIGNALVKLTQLLSNDQHIVNTFLDAIGAEAVVCPEPEKIANANTPMQWKILQRKLAK